MRLPVLVCTLLFAIACSPYGKRTIHDAPISSNQLPTAPDYSDAAMWAALPTRVDNADGSPEELGDRQATAVADVFFIYPTLFTKDPGDRYPWNASVTDAPLNERIDNSTIRLQASTFNGAGKVYAPRYRQAHISAYYTDDEEKSEAAFDTAYADVRRAFEYYLDNYNAGRPIIIASHSQGSTHGKRLLRDYFDGDQSKMSGRAPLVAAYLIGMPIMEDYYTTLGPCEDATQTNCFITWRSWQRPAMPNDARTTPPYPVVVNPLTWTTDTTYVGNDMNQGGTLRKLKLIEGLSDAQVHNGVLWINRPDFFGKRIITMDNWHPADIGLFYESVYRNAIARVEAQQREVN